MFFRAFVIGAASLLCSNLAAIAQIDSESMGDMDAWGTGYLTDAEPEFPASLWLGSDNANLLNLMQALEPTAMTRTERSLLRRVILSPARRPEGDLSADLLLERARLMIALGEADAAAALAPHLGDAGAALEADAILIDLDLASGNEATACGQMTALNATGDYWLKLRAVCAVLRENYSGAELAVEFATAQGLDDPWFVEAVFAASGDLATPPQARFDSGLNIALSLHAALPIETATTAAAKPSLAAAAVSHPRLPKFLRQEFAQIASEDQQISGKAYRQILSEDLNDPDYIVANEIELALQTLDDPIALTDAQLENLTQALTLSSQNNLARFSATARLFAPDIKRLATTPESVAHAVLFAKAALAIGDPDLALTWLRAREVDGEDDPFEVTSLKILALWLGADIGEGSHQAIQNALVGVAMTEAQSKRAADLLAMSAGLGYSLGPDARSVLQAHNSDHSELTPYRRLGLEAAVQSGAIGEAALLVLAETRGEPETLSSADIAALASVLRSIDAEDIAIGLALEASRFWHSEASDAP